LNLRVNALFNVGNVGQEIGVNLDDGYFAERREIGAGEEQKGSLMRVK
jgi:hypothetical protein